MVMEELPTTQQTPPTKEMQDIPEQAAGQKKGLSEGERNML